MSSQGRESSPPHTVQELTTHPLIDHLQPDLDGEDALKVWIRIVRRRGAIVLGVMGVCFLLSLLLCFVMRPKFESTCTLFVDKSESSGLELGSLQSLVAAAGGEDDVKTELQTRSTILSSDTTILAVADALHLIERPPFNCKPGLLNKCFPGEQNLPLAQAPGRREAFLKAFRKNLNVTIPADTRLIQVSVQNPDPELAAAIANSLAEKYIQGYLETRFQATAQASHWLSNQLEDLKKHVKESQDRLSDFEHKTGLSVMLAGISSSSDTGASGDSSMAPFNASSVPAIQRLGALNQEVTAAEADRIAKEAIYHLTQTNSPEVVLGLQGSPLTSVGSGSSVLSGGNGLSLLQSLRQQESALKLAYADAQTKYGAQNPRVESLREQSRALDQQVSLELARINERAKNDWLLAKHSEEELQSRFSAQKSEVSKVNDDLTQLEVYAVEALSSRNLYEGLSAKLQEAGVTAGVKATNVSIADIARPAHSAIKPNWVIYPLIGLSVGIFLGIATGLLWDKIDDAITAPSDMSELSGLPLLTYIPHYSISKVVGDVADDAAVDPSLLISAPNSPEAEQFRALRTSIQLSVLGSSLKTLLVTSALGAEGKSTVTYNLAISFALEGKRVLLVDADMRKPTMHALFRGTRTPGLSTILTTNMNPREAMQSHPQAPTLSLIPAGPTPPLSAELLASTQFENFLSSMAKEFDLVLIDSPPVLLVTDATILTTKVDGTVLVIRAGKTTRPAARTALQILAKSPGRKIGFILNDFDTRSADYYYSQGYYGGSGYYGEAK